MEIVPAAQTSLDARAKPASRDAETLRTVETLLERGQSPRAFPRWLEERFESETSSKRADRLFQTTIFAVVVYNAFLACDVALSPNTLGLSAALHIFVVTPLILAVARLIRSNPPKLLCDLASAAIPVAMVLQILCVYVCSRSENSPHYLYFVLITTIVTNGALRMSHRSARWASLTDFALLLLAEVVTQRVPLGVTLMHCISYTVCAYSSLRGNLDRERDFRRFYLHRLRDSLRFAASDLEARRDALTGLANRRRLDEASEELWSRDDDEVSPVSAILFDIDRFKAFNDRYGHPSGDGCLKRVAACAGAELRKNDQLVARYGGEEFMLLLPQTTLGDAMRIADRLRAAIAAMAIPHEGSELGFVTASFGVAAAPVSASSFASLTAAADAALYASKRGGRNRVSGPPAD